ncbi:uncharacterized protein ACNS7B_008172 isoform 2-T3 [Menidia menidia]
MPFRGRGLAAASVLRMACGGLLDPSCPPGATDLSGLWLLDAAQPVPCRAEVCDLAVEVPRWICQRRRYTGPPQAAERSSIRNTRSLVNKPFLLKDLFTSGDLDFCSWQRLGFGTEVESKLTVQSTEARRVFPAHLEHLWTNPTALSTVFPAGAVIQRI